jgi:hypothetical protein
MILPTEQKFERISLDNILKDSNPLLHQWLRVGRQVVGLGGRRDLEGVGPVRARDSTCVLKHNQPLRLTMSIVLKK